MVDKCRALERQLWDTSFYSNNNDYGYAEEINCFWNLNSQQAFSSGRCHEFIVLASQTLSELASTGGRRG